MRLFYEEIYKIIRSPQILLVMLVFISSIFLTYLDYSKWEFTSGGNISRYNEYVSQYEGKIDVDLANTFKTDFADNITRYDYLKDTTISAEERMKITFHQAYYLSYKKSLEWLQLESENKNLPQSLNAIQELLKELELKGDTNSFFYKSYSKTASMLENIGRPFYYYNVAGIQYMLTCLGGMNGMIYICCMILLVICCPIFADEYKNNMNDSITTSKLGRKTIVHTKYMAGLFISLSMVTIYFWSTIIIYLTIFKNWGTLGLPIQSVNFLCMCPYKLTIAQMILVDYLICIISCFAIISVICIISAFTYNTISCAIASFIFIFLPFANIIGFIELLFPSFSIQTNIVFGGAHFFNIFGYAISYPYLSQIVSILIGYICFTQCYRIYCISRGLKN